MPTQHGVRPDQHPQSAQENFQQRSQQRREEGAVLRTKRHLCPVELPFQNRDLVVGGFTAHGVQRHQIGGAEILAQDEDMHRINDGDVGNHRVSHEDGFHRRLECQDVHLIERDLNIVRIRSRSCQRQRGNRQENRERVSNATGGEWSWQTPKKSHAHATRPHVNER